MLSSIGKSEKKPPAHEKGEQQTPAEGEGPESSNLSTVKPNDEVEEDYSGSDENIEKVKEAREAARYAALRNHRIRFEDAIEPNAERVKTMNKYDVVFGRGRGHQNHPGNLRMRNIVEKYKAQYHSLKRQEKREMVGAVYKEIIEDGAKFLKKVDDEDAWVKVDVPVALQKVSHTLRCRKNVEKQVAESESALAGGQYPHLSNAQIAGGAPHPHAALVGMFGNPSMNVGIGPAFSPLNGLEAHRMAALQRYRVLSGIPAVMPGSSMAMPPNVDYYSMMRRDQLIRETFMLQQMGDACLREGAQTRIPESLTPAVATSRGLNVQVKQPSIGERPPPFE